MSTLPGSIRKKYPGTGWKGGAISRGNLQAPISSSKGSLTGSVIPATSSITQENDDADVAKKKARVAEIIAANRKKRQSQGAKKSNVSGEGTVSPILYSYPSSYTDQPSTSSAFSISDIPSIVWIILAVAGGWFLIKSVRKR